jgi:hypothetical protein
VEEGGRKPVWGREGRSPRSPPYARNSRGSASIPAMGRLRERSSPERRKPGTGFRGAAAKPLRSRAGPEGRARQHRICLSRNSDFCERVLRRKLSNEVRLRQPRQKIRSCATTQCGLPETLRQSYNVVFGGIEDSRCSPDSTCHATTLCQPELFSRGLSLAWHRLCSSLC